MDAAKRRFDLLRSKLTPLFEQGLDVMVRNNRIAIVIQGDALFDVAILTLGHKEHLGEVVAGYGTDVDRDLIRAWWSLRCLTNVRWLAEHGYGSPEEFPEVAVLRRVWARHFERAGTGSGDNTTGGDHAGGRVQLRPAQGRGPGDRVESPYDTEARFRAKAGTNWTGYMVHLTETCDKGRPHLVVHADTAL